MVRGVEVPVRMSHLSADAGSRFGWEGMAAVPPYTRADPTTEGWSRSRDDANVQARMAHLKENGGIKGLEVRTKPYWY